MWLRILCVAVTLNRGSSLVPVIIKASNRLNRAQCMSGFLTLALPLVEIGEHFANHETKTTICEEREAHVSPREKKCKEQMELADQAVVYNLVDSVLSAARECLDLDCSSRGKTTILKRDMSVVWGGNLSRISAILGFWGGIAEVVSGYHSVTRYCTLDPNKEFTNKHPEEPAGPWPAVVSTVGAATILGLYEMEDLELNDQKWKEQTPDIHTGELRPRWRQFLDEYVGLQDKELLKLRSGLSLEEKEKLEEKKNADRDDMGSLVSSLKRQALDFTEISKTMEVIISSFSILRTLLLDHSGAENIKYRCTVSWLLMVQGQARIGGAMADYWQCKVQEPFRERRRRGR